jgi:hypothetical protein
VPNSCPPQYKILGEFSEKGKRFTFNFISEVDFNRFYPVYTLITNDDYDFDKSLQLIENLLALKDVNVKVNIELARFNNTLQPLEDIDEASQILDSVLDNMDLAVKNSGVTAFTSKVNGENVTYTAKQVKVAKNVVSNNMKLKRMIAEYPFTVGLLNREGMKKAFGRSLAYHPMLQYTPRDNLDDFNKYSYLKK